MLRIQVHQKIYRGRAGAAAKLVFQDFLLSVPVGEVCAVLGPSGVGKTSLLNLAAGLDRDFDGEVSGGGNPVGYMFQSPRLFPWRTVRQNVQLTTGLEAAAVDGWLDRVGLPGEGDTFPPFLSAGMAQRVALVRALAVRPQLLLLDEPFSALDRATADRMRNLVANHIADARPTALLVTHDLSDATALADRVVVLGGAPAHIVKDVRMAEVGTGLPAEQRLRSALANAVWKDAAE